MSPEKVAGRVQRRTLTLTLDERGKGRWFSGESWGGLRGHQSESQDLSSLEAVWAVAGGSGLSGGLRKEEKGWPRFAGDWLASLRGEAQELLRAAVSSRGLERSW